MAFETVKKNLEARGFSVQTFATAAEAAEATCSAPSPAILGESASFSS